MEISPGQTVDLVVRWGSQKRLKCPRCQHFARDAGATRITCSCGAVFAAIADSEQHQVVLA